MRPWPTCALMQPGHTHLMDSRQTATTPCIENDRAALQNVEQLLLALADDREQSGAVRWQLECLALELRVRLGWLH